MRVAQRVPGILAGTLVVMCVCVGWLISWGLGLGSYIFVVLLFALGIVPFSVGRGLVNRRGHSRFWLGLLGFAVGLVIGWFAADLLDRLTHVPDPDPDIERFRMRLDILFGALAGATLFSSLGVLLGSKPPAGDSQDRL